MEWQKTVSEILVILTVILMAVMVAYPLSMLAAQTTARRLSRMRVHGIRRIIRKLSRGTLRAFGQILPFQRSSAYCESKPHAGRRFLAREAASGRHARDRRRQPRVAICFGATLHTGQTERGAKACDVLDLSAGGARVRLNDPVGRVSRITLRLTDFGAFRARVVWRNADELGLKFESEAQTVVSRMRGLLPPLQSLAAA